MKDLDDSQLENEIDDIMGRVDSILGKIEEFYPTRQEDMDQNVGEGGANGRKWRT